MICINGRSDPPVELLLLHERDGKLRRRIGLVAPHPTVVLLGVNRQVAIQLLDLVLLRRVPHVLVDVVVDVEVEDPVGLEGPLDSLSRI